MYYVCICVNHSNRGTYGCMLVFNLGTIFWSWFRDSWLCGLLAPVFDGRDLIWSYIHLGFLCEVLDISSRTHRLQTICSDALNLASLDLLVQTSTNFKFDNVPLVSYWSDLSLIPSYCCLANYTTPKVA